MIPPISWC